MSLFRQVAVRRTFEMLGLVVVVASAAQAQQTPPVDPHRWGIQLAGDLGSMPDAFTHQCGNGKGGAPAYGGGVSLLRRFRDRFVAIADMRGSGVIHITGCKLVLPPPKLIGTNQYETHAKTSYPGGVPTETFGRSAVRIGIESWQGYPMARALVGGGFFWGTRTPFVTAGIEGGTRGDGTRITFGIETSRARIRVEQLYTRYEWDGTTQTSMPSRSESFVDMVGWTMVHMGVEIPLR